MDSDLASRPHERGDTSRSTDTRTVLAAQRGALEAALNDAPLEVSLGLLTRAAAAWYGDGVRAAFYLANEEGTALRHIVGMPADYAAVVDGFAVGPDSLACGYASHTGEPVLTADVQQEPRWAPWRGMAERFDYRGCWSFPIHSLKGELVGTFAVYWRQPREAGTADVDLAEVITQSSAIIIARAKDAELQARAEAALRASEARLQTLVEGVPQLVWRAVDSGEWTWASPQWTAYTGQTEADSHGFGWLDPVHPEDRERVKGIWDEAAMRGEFTADYRICHTPQRRYRWFQTRAAPVRDREGRVIEWLGTSTDVDDLRRLQEHQSVLVGELQHRVRNILAVIRSVFSRSVESGYDLETTADHFRGRLDALARTQVIVTRNAAGVADLEDLIREELLSVGAVETANVKVEGPEVLLPAKTAESIGLAIHELTTNALKYGALKTDGASLDVSWYVNLDQGLARRLNLEWIERGVPAVSLEPAREGFGRELIERALPYRLGAHTSLEFRGGGIRCSISMPLPDEEAAAGKD